MSFFLIDSHCHVQFRAYREDRDDVIRRSLAEGIHMIAVGTQSSTSKAAVETAEAYDGVWACIGLHPSHTCEQEFVDENEEETNGPGGPIKTRCEVFDADFYRTLAQSPKVVAIGECGFDLYHLPEQLTKEEVVSHQEAALRGQMDLADVLNLPLVIHSRNAHVEQYELLKEYVEAGKLQRRGVIHCFTGTLEEAEAYLGIGFLLSFTGIMTFPPRKGEGEISPIQKVIQALPLESILVETDAPYLAPVPVRGQRNEPRHVVHVAAKIAELKGMTTEEIAEITSENAKRFFGI